MKYFKGKRFFKFPSQTAEVEYRTVKGNAMKGFFKVYKNF